MQSLLLYKERQTPQDWGSEKVRQKLLRKERERVVVVKLYKNLGSSD